MKFMVRDDDACGFTCVEELQNCYARIRDDVPVCLEVLPVIAAAHVNLVNSPALVHRALEWKRIPPLTDLAGSIEPGVNGLVYPYDNASALARWIERRYRDRYPVRLMWKAARETVHG
jgi:hypothetical protein